MIEEDIKEIKFRLSVIETRLTHLVVALVPKKQDTKELSAKAEEALKTGDNPRFCACGKKLGKLKEQGKCKTCMKLLQEKGD